MRPFMASLRINCIPNSLAFQETPGVFILSDVCKNLCLIFFVVFFCAVQIFFFTIFPPPNSFISLSNTIPHSLPFFITGEIDSPNVSDWQQRINHEVHANVICMSMTSLLWFIQHFINWTFSQMLLWLLKI